MAMVALLPGACGSGGSSVPSDIAVQCSQPLLRQGSSVQPKESACEVRFTNQLAALKCDQTEPITGFNLIGFDLSTGREDDTIVRNEAAAGSCNLRVPSGYAGGLISTSQPTNPVAIVDFTPASGSATLLIALRCSVNIGVPPCIFVRIGTDESYQCLEDRVSNAPGYVLAHGSYANQQYPAPSLNIGSPNRLVVQLSGDKLVAYLNTRLVCAGKVSAQSALAPVDFLVFAQTDSSVTVTTFVVGEPT